MARPYKGGKRASSARMRRRKKERGECLDCPKRASMGLLRCAVCTAKKNDASIERRAAKRMRGECYDCPAQADGGVRCGECARKHAEAKAVARTEKYGHVKPSVPGSNLVRGLQS